MRYLPKSRDNLSAQWGDMKKNLPVTQQEINYAESSVFVTKTDTKGIITYANDSFVEVSGFSREELIGTNHNLVRHPDMPSGIQEPVGYAQERSSVARHREKIAPKTAIITGCALPCRRSRITVRLPDTSRSGKNRRVPKSRPRKRCISRAAYPRKNSRSPGGSRTSRCKPSCSC